MAAALDARWDDLLVVEVDRPTIERAASLVKGHILRSSDAIHLATALSLREGSTAATRFVCFDRRLWEAAGVLEFDRILVSSA